MRRSRPVTKGAAAGFFLVGLLLAQRDPAEKTALPDLWCQDALIDIITAGGTDAVQKCGVGQTGARHRKHHRQGDEG